LLSLKPSLAVLVAISGLGATEKKKPIAEGGDLLKISTSPRAIVFTHLASCCLSLA
jgi:hypothetical protein